MLHKLLASRRPAWPRASGSPQAKGCASLLALMLLGALAIVASCTSGPPALSSPAPTPRPTRVPHTVEALASVEVQAVAGTPTPVRRIAQVRILPAQVALTPGQRTIFSATGQDATGATVSKAQLSWQVLQAEAGAISQDGVFTAGQRIGTYSLTIQVKASQSVAGGTIVVTDQASVIITRAEGQAPLNLLTVYPEEVSIDAGTSLGIGALGWDERGRLVPGLALEWQMANPTAGTIDKLGFFRASQTPGMYAGAIRVTGTQQTGAGTVVKEALVDVEVTQPSGEELRPRLVVLPNVARLTPGQQASFSAFAFDNRGNRITDYKVAWSAALPAAGKVSGTGEFVAGSTVGVYPHAVKAVGIQTIDGRVVTFEATATVSVAEPQSVRRLSFAHAPIEVVTLKPYQSNVLAAVGLDDEGAAVPQVKVEWTMADPRAGSVDPFGLFTAGAAPGIYPRAVTATVSQELDGQLVVAEAAITVRVLGPLQRVEITPSPVRVLQGESVRLTAAGYDANGLRILDLRFQWSVVRPEAGAIQSDGTFTASRAPGAYAGAIKVVAEDVDS